jgi:hypothetical protein
MKDRPAASSSEGLIESEVSPFQTNRRRSQRVVARIRIKVIRREGADFILSEDTQTLVVSAHGALLVLAMIVQPGEALLLKNSMSNEEQQVRVIRVGEKQTPPKEVAVEFTSPGPHFWHIDFPPIEWEQLRHVPTDDPQK